MKTIIAAATVLASLATSAFALEPTKGHTVSGEPQASYEQAPAGTSLFHTGSVSNQSRDDYRTADAHGATSLEPSHD
ncbi:hypothetical protein [Ciceribacter ferrooxidans]|uniref:Uncharacterized protein n=1 Tax=Ciceribacter ferrooxidans TaxID=2509717 RepID=A0A4Q2T5I3_9HYPH|nr:hypothetical protein [Ciceribacter ferrooxidans]RYC12168.1 hypothetical protein EUU22_14020 [Ciceribacter ferrooxidans]